MVKCSVWKKMYGSESFIVGQDRSGEGEEADLTILVTRGDGDWGIDG